MKPIYIINRIVFIFALTFSISAGAEPILNGIASHQELGQEQFIGALYSESVSENAEVLLAANQPMRIELKILIEDGISSRRFNRMWIDGMAINNGPNILTEQANNIVKFDSLFKGRLEKGDLVTFKLTPLKGVDVALNNIALGNINSDKFFTLLLSSWIGKIPLSSDFKDNILKVSPQGQTLKARYDAIKSGSQRTADVLTWKESSQPASSSVAARASSSQASRSVQIEVPIDTPKPKIDLSDIGGITSSSSSTASLAATKSSIKSSSPAIDDEDDSGPAFTTQSLLARQFYIRDAILQINKSVRYPVSALQKGQEGSVRVAVRLDRSGNIVDIEASEPSQFNALTKEAIAAIKRAAPFKELPLEITGNTFEFTAPIRFTLLNKPKK